MRFLLGFVFITFIFSCNSDNQVPDSGFDTTLVVNKADGSSWLVMTRKPNDTFSRVFPETVVFLRPDEKTFDSISKVDENIYEADSDFGFAINNTIDSMKRKFKRLSYNVVTDRYIYDLSSRRTFDRKK